MVEGIQSLPSPQIPISRGCYFQNCAQRNCGLSQQPKLWAVKHCLNAINFILSHPYLWGNLQNSSAPNIGIHGDGGLCIVYGFCFGHS